MFDFNDIRTATSDEKMRAWSVEQAIEIAREEISSMGVGVAPIHVLKMSDAIYQFVKNGKEETNAPDAEGTPGRPELL